MAQRSFFGEAKDRIVGAVGRYFGLNMNTQKKSRASFSARNAGFVPQEAEPEENWNEATDENQEWQNGSLNAWQPPQGNYQAPQAGPYQAQPQQAAPQNMWQGQAQQGSMPPQSNPYQNVNPYQAAQPVQPKQQAGGRENVVYFPGTEAQREEAFSARVISARSVSECYSAITQLRQGDIVILVMDHITDPAEMRHYVDMLSGACYSLRATITKLSRHGAYLISPSKVRVFVDATTSQLNSAARQPQRPLQNPYGQSRANASMSYADPYQNSYQNNSQNNYQAGMNQQQRYANGISYVGRQAAPEAQAIATELQPYANGYMPDGPLQEASSL
ncbi:MAG: cell division protein SepF [Clostridia bacterium]|nr:cell division protein SepF [Clostridia bacterium]